MTINRAELESAVSQGFVKATVNGSLTLYNYADRCVFEKAWTGATLAARGLILGHDGEVVARPFRKFFNLGEHVHTLPENLVGLGTPELADKLDGSLLVVFLSPETGRWTAVTRGCWDNPQTRWANAWLERSGFEGQPGYTYLFELIAPWNRIVLFYAQEEMVLLGVVENATGLDTSYADTRRIAAVLGVRGVPSIERDWREIDLADPLVRDREGYVARFPGGHRVKMKFAQYLYLHKTLTGLSVKNVWEHLAAGTTPPLDNVPDEFMAWHDAQINALRGKFAEASAVVDATWGGADWKAMPRRDAALAWKDHPLKAALFRRLDGKSDADILWKSVKPDHHETFQAPEAS